MQEPIAYTGVHGTPEGLEWVAATYELHAAQTEYFASLDAPGPPTPAEESAGAYYGAAVGAAEAAYERYAGGLRAAA